MGSEKIRSEKNPAIIRVLATVLSKASLWSVALSAILGTACSRLSLLGRKVQDLFQSTLNLLPAWAPCSSCCCQSEHHPSFGVGFMKESSPICPVWTVRMDYPVQRSVVHTHKSAGTRRCVNLLQDRDDEEIIMYIGMLWWIV